ncbi:mechanosensitive ion channel family protein [Roseivirga sp. BDSF3-8]|uniref:mechanosensitive ion channel family protein n=1 Tax=Roseivirga sp. BDSF3-8 TaxID=3241598 RepID=UPI003531CF7B
MEWSSIKKQENRRRFFFGLKLLLLLLLIFLDNIYFEEIHKEAGVPARITQALIFYLTAHLVIILTRLIIVRVYIRKKKAPNRTDTFVIGITRIASLLSALAFVFSILYAFDIAIKELFTSLTIVAAAIAIIFKDYIGNMINGLIIMFSGQLQVNDYIRIGNNRGRIMDITFLNIHLLNDDDDIVYIPNTTIILSDVLNYSAGRQNKAGVEFEIATGRLTDPEALHQYLMKQITHFKEVVPGTGRLRIVSMSKDFAVCRFQVRINQSQRETEKAIRQKLLTSVATFEVSE